MAQEPTAQAVFDEDRLNAALDELDATFDEGLEEEIVATSQTQELILPQSSGALSILRKLSINLIVPFVNGICLGFGEIFAMELGFWWGWRGASVYDPAKKQITPGTRLQYLFGK